MSFLQKQAMAAILESNDFYCYLVFILDKGQYLNYSLCYIILEISYIIHTYSLWYKKAE